MAIPLRLIQASCLILAAALGLLTAGCAGEFGAPSLSAPAAPSPTPAAHHKSHPTTALDLLLGSQFGILTPRDAALTCGTKDRTVVVRGSVQGHRVTVRLSGLRGGQHLAVPPPVGGYDDLVTVVVAGASPTQSFTLTYVVGFIDGAYQGVGSIDVSKRGTSGRISVSAPSPVGEAPQIQVQGLYDVTAGVNGMSLDGAWRCP